MVMVKEVVKTAGAVAAPSTKQAAMCKRRTME